MRSNLFLLFNIMVSYIAKIANILAIILRNRKYEDPAMAFKYESKQN